MDANGNASGFWQTYNKVGPRVGFSFNPNPLTVLRGGYDLLYLPSTQRIYSSSTLGFAQTTQQTYTFSQRPTTLVDNPLRVAWRCPQVPASGVQAGTGTSVPGLLCKNPQPYYSQWNLGVDQQLTSKMVLHLNYAGSKGTHLPITYRPNDLQPRYLVPWAIRVAGSRHTFRLPCRIPCTARLEQVASLLIRRCPAAVAAGLSAVRANGHVTAEWNAVGDPG